MTPRCRPRRSPYPALLAAGLVGCTGVIGPAGDDTGAGPGSGVGHGGGAATAGETPGAGAAVTVTAAQCQEAADTGPSVLRRLSRLEYQLTLQQLFQLPDAPLVEGVPQDSELGGFRTVAAIQNISDQHLRAYLETAETLGAALLADGARRNAVVGCDGAAAGCLQSFTASFGRLAYRRALTATEVTDLVAAAQVDAVGTDEPFQYVIEALLTSPSFLYRVEVGEGSGAVASLTRSELAAKLSFEVLGRSPSKDLLDRAERGDLDTAQGLGAAAAELVQDPGARTFFAGFFKQWLTFEELRVPPTPPPGWSDALLPDMIQETETLLDEFAWGTKTDFLGALTANHTTVTPLLGAFYGLPVGAGTGAQRVELPAAHQRANTGLLTHGSLISAKGDSDLIATRGKWIRNTFLCEELKVPPGLLEGLQAELSTLTYPQVVQKRNTQQPCAGCHSQIDPIGVGFGQYDGAGYYDAALRTDDLGVIPRFEGAENPDFRSVSDLARELQKMPDLAPCVAKKVFVFMEGRKPAASDGCMLVSATDQFAADAHQFRSLVGGLVASPAFRLRRAPE